MKINKLIFTKKLPKVPGYYWWTNFGEHTPTILRVEKSCGKLWADNGEYTFEIKEEKQLTLIEDNDPDLIVEGNYKYGDELWCHIPNPYLPNGKKQVKPDCY